ncbi:ribose 5-phosphate isomerase B [bacterium]|nr:ribose 5-phosphate isomerase B [bacterium]
MRVAIGADHGGFELKRELMAALTKKGFEVADMGTYTPDSVDYPDIAAIVAFEVAKGNYPMGILIDGAGNGSAISANKIKGIRAAVCNNLFMASSAREHNDANILVLGAAQTAFALALQIAETFLNQPFGGGRHERRLNKIKKLEDANQKDIEKYTAPPKKLITGDDVRIASKEKISVIYYEKGAIVTDMAKELSFDLNVRLVER